MGNSRSFEQQRRRPSAVSPSSFAPPVRPFALVPAPASQPVSLDGDARLEHARRFGHSLDRLSILPPEQDAMTPEHKGLSIAHLGQKQEGDQTREQHSHSVPKKNTTGMPDALKAGIESLAGMSVDDIHVHYNSSKPAQMRALAYAQGTEIHMGPGQERHLAHEAWHVVQQKQGRVKPALQLYGMEMNNDSALEQEAHMMGKRASQLDVSNVSMPPSGSSHPSGTPVVQRLISKMAGSFVRDREKAIDKAELDETVEQLLQEGKGPVVNYYRNPNYQGQKTIALAAHGNADSLDGQNAKQVAQKLTLKDLSIDKDAQITIVACNVGKGEDKSFAAKLKAALVKKNEEYKAVEIAAPKGPITYTTRGTFILEKETGTRQKARKAMEEELAEKAAKIHQSVDNNQKAAEQKYAKDVTQATDDLEKLAVKQRWQKEDEKLEKLREQLMKQLWQKKRDWLLDYREPEKTPKGKPKEGTAVTGRTDYDEKEGYFVT